MAKSRRRVPQRWLKRRIVGRANRDQVTRLRGPTTRESSILFQIREPTTQESSKLFDFGSRPHKKHLSCRNFVNQPHKIKLLIAGHLTKAPYQQNLNIQSLQARGLPAQALDFYIDEISIFVGIPQAPVTYSRSYPYIHCD